MLRGQTLLVFVHFLSLHSSNDLDQYYDEIIQLVKQHPSNVFILQGVNAYLQLIRFVY